MRRKDTIFFLIMQIYLHICIIFCNFAADLNEKHQLTTNTIYSNTNFYE